MPSKLGVTIGYTELVRIIKEFGLEFEFMEKALLTFGEKRLKPLIKDAYKNKLLQELGDMIRPEIDEIVQNFLGKVGTRTSGWQVTKFIQLHDHVKEAVKAEAYAATHELLNTEVREMIKARIEELVNEHTLEAYINARITPTMNENLNNQVQAILTKSLSELFKKE